MSANFSPEMEGYSGIKPFRFWCQKVLPLVYDDSLSYYELLCKVVDYLNHTIEDLSATETNVDALKDAYDELETYVNNYFDNLNIQGEVNNKLDAMALDGTLSDLIAPFVSQQIGGVVASQIGDVVGAQIDGAVSSQIVGVVAEQLRGSYGAPLVSSTVAGMTDHQRVYVYTGSESGYVSGNWYYWNGTAWTSGGVYNAEAITIDSTLNTNSTNAVQNKVVASKINEIESVIDVVIGGDDTNIIDSSTDTMVARFSDNVSFSGSVVTFTTNTSGSNYVNIYVPIERNTSYDFLIGNDSSLQVRGYKLTDTISDQWNPGGYMAGASGTVHNVNNAYFAYSLVAVNSFAGSIPLTLKKHYDNSLLELTESNADTLSDVENIFSAQKCTFKARFGSYAKMIGHEVRFSANTSGSNYTNVYIPLKFGAHYTIDFGGGTDLQAYGMKLTNSIANDAGNQGFVTNVNSFWNDGENNQYLVILLQAISTFTGEVEVVVREDTHLGFKARVGTGYAYDSILAAMKGTPHYVELILVDNTYDLMEEYEDYYGATFWDDYEGYSGATDYFMCGLWLDGFRKITGTGNTTIKMEYDGDNASVKSDFSVLAFYPQYSKVEVSNLTIKYSGIRYAIHDDFTPTHAKIVMDGLIVDGSSETAAALGGGLGVDTVYDIKNCIFLNNSKTYDISYHGSTNAATKNKCRINISNCYGSKACAFRWYGASTAVSDCIVNNSKFGSIACVEYDSSQPNENMRLISYLNETT